MKNLLAICLLTISTLLVFISCDEGEDIIDTTAPTIEVEEPVNGEYFIAGDYAHFEAKFTDDFELATYNIEIHDNFGGHSHGRIANAKSDPSLIKWTYKQSFLIPEGLTLFQAILEDEIDISSNAMAGPYHFIVQAIDQAGNASSFQDDSAVELEVYMANDSQPVVTITNLINGELEIEVAVPVMVEGTVTDPTTGEYAGMHSLSVVLGEGLHEDHDHNHGGRIAEEDLIDVYFEGEDLKKFMVDGAIILEKVFEDINFTLSQDQLNDLIEEELDYLLLTIKVFDEQGNIAVSNTDVHLHLE
jgi:hypothetical protein